MENEFHKQMAEDFTCLDNPTKLHGSQGCYLGHLQNLVKSWTTRTSVTFLCVLKNLFGIIGCKLVVCSPFKNSIFGKKKKVMKKKPTS